MTANKFYTDKKIRFQKNITALSGFFIERLRFNSAMVEKLFLAEEYSKMLEVQINLGKIYVEIERTARELNLNGKNSVEDFEDVTIIQLPPKNKKS